jgi:hypothetical protein
MEYTGRMQIAGSRQKLAGDVNKLLDVIAQQ